MIPCTPPTCRLIIDTSTPWCLLAVEHNGTLTESIFRHENRLSSHLLPSIRALLEQLNLTPQHLLEILLGTGPGSYTGTRVGASVAKTLAFALSIPLRPFYSPQAFLPVATARFGFLLPTKAGTYFTLTPETAQLLHPTQLVAWAEKIDALVLHPEDATPIELTHKPRLMAYPNPSLLMPYLDSLPSQDAEDVVIAYFGRV